MSPLSEQELQGQAQGWGCQEAWPLSSLQSTSEAVERSHPAVSPNRPWEGVGPFRVKGDVCWGASCPAFGSRPAGHPEGLAGATWEHPKPILWCAASKSPKLNVDTL